MKSRFTLFFIILTLLNCQNEPTNQNSPNISLKLLTNQASTSELTTVDQFRIEIVNIDNEVIKDEFYSASTKSIVLDNLQDQTQISVFVEAYNVMGHPFRRGRAESVKIEGDTNQTITLTITSVPFFANIKQDGILLNNRFQPLVYSDSAGDLELVDEFEGISLTLTDQLSGLTSLSINQNLKYLDQTGFYTMATPILDAGQHRLKVIDRTTNESSFVDIYVVNGLQEKAITTTSGAFLGTIGNMNSNLIQFYEARLD